MTPRGPQFVLEDRVLFVCGITSSQTWFTGYRKPSGGVRRFRSPSLPVRTSRDEAQADLERFARERGLRLAVGMEVDQDI